MKHFFSKTLFSFILIPFFLFSCKPGGSSSSKFASSSASKETYSHYLEDSSFLADDDFGRDFVVEKESSFQLFTFNESKNAWYQVVASKKLRGGEYSLSLLAGEELTSSSDYFSIFDSFHEEMEEEFRFSRGTLRSGLNLARLCDEQVKDGLCALGLSSKDTLTVSEREGSSLVFRFTSLEEGSNSLKNHEVFSLEAQGSGSFRKVCPDFSEGVLRLQEEGECSSRFKLVLKNYTSCGDGLVQINEECDDNNRVSRDGCDSLCYREPDPLDCNRDDEEKNIWDSCGQCVAEGKEKDCHNSLLSDEEMTFNEGSIFSGRSQKLFAYNPEKDSWHQVTVKEVGGEFLFDFLEESAEEKNFYTFDFYSEGEEKEFQFEEGTIKTSINVADLCDTTDFEKFCSLSVSSSGKNTFVSVGKLENKGKTFSLKSFGPYNGKLTYYDPFFIGYKKDGVDHTLCADFSAEAFSLDPVPEFEEDGCRTAFKIHYSDYTSCGDEVVQHDESCDDGNQDTEEECPYGTKNCSYCSGDCSESLSLTGRLCGDGVNDEEEACDDGNLTDETSCAYGIASCSFCSSDCLSVLSLTGPVCGDGTADAEEECDDGNTETESVCPYGSASCTLCSSDCQEALSLTGSYCGDGITDTEYETCDDNNTTTETACPYGESSCSYCSSDCSELLLSDEGDLTTSYCGDGIEDSSNSESCDDGNTESGDGCESCSIVSGYTCDNDSDVYCSVCGDGTLGGEEICDDGDTVTEDNCDYGTPSCTLCNADCSLEIDRTGSYCGDGVEDLVNGEECDDGGNLDGDGCGSTCFIETGYTCDLDASLYCSRCGDGSLGGEEVCDDGDTITETDCPYNETSCEYCNADCSAPLKSEDGDLTVSYCGDGTIDSANSETCEDGNGDADDGCSDICQVEEGSTCCEDGYFVSSLESSTKIVALAGAGEPQTEVRCPPDTVVASYAVDYSSSDGVTSLQLKCKEYSREDSDLGSVVETVGFDSASTSKGCGDGKVLTGFKFFTDASKKNFLGLGKSCQLFSNIVSGTVIQASWSSLVGSDTAYSQSISCEDGYATTGFKYSKDSSDHIQSLRLLCEKINRVSCDNSLDSYCSACGDEEVGGMEACDIAAEGMVTECTEYGENCEACSDDCTVYSLLEGPHCGDGIVDSNNNEACDDGNLDSGDGCDACAVETGWDCSSGTCCLLNNFYADTDGDGAGDPDNLKQSCESSLSGYVLDDTSDECPGDGDVVSVATSDTDCDGVDDDCNGTADDGYVVTDTECGTGACASTGTLSCISGSEVDSCVAGTAASSDADCDGVDDDCNGTADDGYLVTDTECGTGACAATGTLSCIDGSEVDSCEEGTAASSDADCDGVDDDCNGTADDGYVVTDTECGTGACASTGTLSCEDGTEVDSCEEGSAASSDADCDGVDDDCDGDTDEDVGSAYGIAYYPDIDGDGSGSGDVEYFCDDPGSGYTTNDDDECPNNPNLTEKVRWYEDNDGDGTGDVNASTYACKTSYTGYSTTTHDYCDNNSEITEKITWYLDEDGDGYGTSSSSKKTCNSEETGYSEDSSDTCDDFYGLCVCGNGSLEGDEECDDGNDTDEDGCTACVVDSDYSCCEDGYQMASKEKLLDLQSVVGFAEPSSYYRCDPGYIATGFKTGGTSGISKFSLECTRLLKDKTLDTSDVVYKGSAPMSATAKSCGSGKVLVGTTLTADDSNFSSLTAWCRDLDDIDNNNHTSTNSSSDISVGTAGTDDTSVEDFCTQNFAITGFKSDYSASSGIRSVRWVCEKLVDKDCSSVDYCSKCGDGTKGGGEVCDAGVDVTDTGSCDTYDGSCTGFCSTDCFSSYDVLGPYCGDNVTQGDEFCDGESWCGSDCQLKDGYNCCEEGYHVASLEEFTDTSGPYGDLTGTKRCADGKIATGFTMFSTSSRSILGLKCRSLNADGTIDTSSSSTIKSYAYSSSGYQNFECDVDNGEVLVGITASWGYDRINSLQGLCFKAKTLSILSTVADYSTNSYTVTGDVYSHTETTESHSVDYFCEGSYAISGLRFAVDDTHTTHAGFICEKVKKTSSCDSTASNYCSSCGDGVVGGQEVCDTAASGIVTSCDAGDVCEACGDSCQEYSLLLGEGCGDGVVQDGEDCDGVWGCDDSDCTELSGFQCDPTENACGECGDGRVDGGEACDDGDRVTDIWCDYGETSCTDCKADCSGYASPSTRYCGDGRVQSDYGESCESGSTCNTTLCRLSNDWGQVEESIYPPSNFGRFHTVEQPMAFADEGRTIAYVSIESGHSYVDIYNYDGGWNLRGNEISYRYSGDSGVEFVQSVALNSDGDLAVVGLPDYLNSGRVDIFEYNSSTNQWELLQEISGYGSYSKTGSSVQLSSDGTGLLVASKGYNSKTGRVDYYIRNSSTGLFELEKSFDGKEEGEQFGYSVDLLYGTAGTFILVGAPYADPSSVSDAGRVDFYYWHADRGYEDDGSMNFELRTEIEGTTTDGLRGYQVGFASTGSIYYAYSAPGESSGKGVITLINYSTGNEYDSIVGSQSGIDFGKVMSIGNGGTYIAVGAPGYDNDYTDAGSVTVYEYSSSGGGYSQKGSVIEGDSAYQALGSRVIISPEGSTIAIMSPALDLDGDGNHEFRGEVALYRYYISSDTSY